MAINNKTSYIAGTVLKEKNSIANFTLETTKLFCYKNFAFEKFQLDILQALLLL